MPAGSFSVCEVCAPVPRTLPSLQSLLAPITASGKSEARPGSSSRMRISGEAQLALAPASVPSSSTCRSVGVCPSLRQST